MKKEKTPKLRSARTAFNAIVDNEIRKRNKKTQENVIEHTLNIDPTFNDEIRERLISIYRHVDATNESISILHCKVSRAESEIKFLTLIICFMFAIISLLFLLRILI